MHTVQQTPPPRATATAPRLDPWGCAASLAVEGACLLARLLPWVCGLATCLHVGHVSGAHIRLLLTVSVAAGQGLLLSPLRLWRVAWYRRLALSNGRLPALPRPVSVRQGAAMCAAAIGWRWQLWWRRCAAMGLAVFCAALVWSAAASAGHTAIGLTVGSTVLLLGLAGAHLRMCRYTAAPLLLLDGCPAGAAMQLSAHLMHGRLTAYLDLCGSGLRHLAPCLLLVPAIWAIPRWQCRRISCLLSWQHARPGAGQPADTGIRPIRHIRRST